MLCIIQPVNEENVLDFGCLPYISLKGDVPVELCVAVRYVYNTKVSASPNHPAFVHRS